jgi:hypothetical protein
MNRILGMAMTFRPEEAGMPFTDKGISLPALGWGPRIGPEPGLSIKPRLNRAGSWLNPPPDRRT